MLVSACKKWGDETYIYICLPEDYHSGLTDFLDDESVFVCTRILAEAPKVVFIPRPASVAILYYASLRNASAHGYTGFGLPLEG